MLRVGQGVAFGALAAVPLLFLAVGLGAGGESLLSWLATWATAIVYLVGALVCAAGARASRSERPAWTWFAVACSLWAAANFYYAFFVSPDPIPLPSPADIGYFAFPWVVSIGLVQLARTRLSRVPGDLVLDAVIVALCAGAVGGALVFSAVDVETQAFGVVLTSLIYPIDDVAMIGVMVGVGMLLGWRLDRPLVLLGIGIIAITAADLIVATRVLSGDPIGGAWPNLGWTLGIGVIALAASTAAVAHEAVATRTVTRNVWVPEIAAAVALIVLGLGVLFDFSPVADVFAVAALAAALVRMHRSFRRAHALADSHRLALADELTDLPNRRCLLRDLQDTLDARTPSLLALFDLDGFKHYNDTHGHPEGDRLLVELATRLAHGVEAHGVAYRLGGDEFCVLTAAGSEGRNAIDTAGARLRASGPGWQVTATHGVVEIPAEADTVSDALRTADRRMYEEKDRRPVAARQQARDVLLSALGEQQPKLHAHTQDVTALAGAVAMSLGMSPREVDDVVRAAELHDVGKLAIPAEILDKPGPLDDAELELMRQHTIIGERMLSAAPALRAIAPLVRWSHERWDGTGYPDRLQGEDIPLGARIVAVCDSYDAMVADRPYRAGMAPEDALAELHRCAGTQFDPTVVDAFIGVLAAETAALG
jgi:two-component system cell cycle response regulator